MANEAVDGFATGQEDFDIEVDDEELGDDDLDKIRQHIHDSAPSHEMWYHGRLGRHEGEMRLKEKGLPSSYLLRESDRRPGVYSLSFLSLCGSISHFRITAICGDYYIGGRKFESLQDLIGYYSSYGNLMKGEKLKVPIPPPKPVHMAYRVVAKFSYDGTPDTDELSFVIGDVFLVHNVLDSEWCWATSQKENRSGLVPRKLTETMDPGADPFEGQPWFSTLSRQETQSILMSYGKVGNFLIRPSENQGNYSLSLRDQTGVTRFLIQRQGRYFTIGGRNFDSIEAIIARYKHEHLAENVSLRDPLDRSEYEAFYVKVLKSSSGTVTDGVSKPLVPSLSRSEKSTQAIKYGFLIKRGHRNKWKRVYTALKGDEQQLLYYENEKRTKPKGLIDLCFATVYGVHESLFGRPNCFQIVLRALNETTTTYLCADTSDQAQEWMDSVAQYCGKLKTPTKAASRGVKELRSLELTVCDARKLSCSKMPHPFCVILLSDVKACRTKASEAPNAVWEEDFKFNDLPNDVTSFTVAIHNRNVRSKDKEIGRVTVQLSAVEPGRVLDNWYPITSVQHKGDLGTVRLKAKYFHEIVMPVEEYSKLKQVIVAPDFQMVHALGSVCKDLNSLALTLLRIFRQEGNELNLIKVITTRDIENDEKKETLFRGNTLAAKLMDQYMKMIAFPYLQMTIKGVILKIMDCKQSCELNPSKIDRGVNAADNLQQVIKFLEEAATSIFNSTHQCPSPLRYLFKCLQVAARARWPEEPFISSRVVSAFLFLRLICPAILNPKMHNLVHETPSPMASRTLTLVATCMQKLANLVEFRAQEPHFVVVNPFVQKYKQKMVDFLDEVSNVAVMPRSEDVTKCDVARDLAAVHETVFKYQQQLLDLSGKHPNLKILVAIAEGIMRQKEKHMKQAEAACDEFAV